MNYGAQALYVTYSVKVRNFHKGSLCVPVKTRKVSHRHCLRFR